MFALQPKCLDAGVPFPSRQWTCKARTDFICMWRWRPRRASLFIEASAKAGRNSRHPWPASQSDAPVSKALPSRARPLLQPSSSSSGRGLGFHEFAQRSSPHASSTFGSPSNDRARDGRHRRSCFIGPDEPLQSLLSAANAGHVAPLSITANSLRPRLQLEPASAACKGQRKEAPGGCVKPIPQPTSQSAGVVIPTDPTQPSLRSVRWRQGHVPVPPSFDLNWLGTPAHKTFVRIFLEISPRSREKS